jgi:cytochrome oxidase assembly protein ShyY1
MHLGYAIQWFAVGAIILLGSIALAWSRRRGAR